GAALGLAPRADRVAAAGALTLAAAVRVVDRVHRDAADDRPPPFPAHAAGFAPVDVGLLGVAHLSNGCPAAHIDATNLAPGHAQRRVAPLLAEKPEARAGRTGQLRAAAGPQLDGVDQRARGDVAQRQVVARLDVGVGTGLDDVTLTQPLRRDDVTLL